jgi:AcrR family transcriptional regulator
MKEDTRGKILDISRQLAEKYGFWSFKVDDILQHVHISRATFYKYFRNREDVLFTLFDTELDRIESTIRAALSEESGSHTRLKVFMTLEIAGMKGLFNALNIRIGEIDISPAIPRQRIEEKNERDLRIIRDILSDGKREGSLVFEDLDLTARAVMGINREIGLKAVMENKDTETIKREISGMLGALLFGISSGKRQ